MHEVFPVNFRGSGLVMAPLTFPRCRLWLAWFPVGSVCFLGFSSRDLLHIPPHPTLCLPALNPGECEFPCKDSEQRIPDPGLTFFCFFPSASWKIAYLIFISPSLSSVWGRLLASGKGSGSHVPFLTHGGKKKA